MSGWASALVCAAAALAVCLWRIREPVLWRDELATWTASSDRSLPELLRMLGNVDASAGAYYLFMHGWTAVFGDSVLALRLPAALAMAGTAACVAVLGRTAFGPRAGLAAGLVFALIPSVSRYGQEARAYGFVCLTAAVSTLLLTRALRTPPSARLRTWAGYAATVPLLGAWHLVGLATLTGHAAWVLAAHRTALRRFAVAVGTGLAVLAPLAVHAAGQRGRQIDWIPRPKPDDVLTFLPRMTASGPVAVLLVVLLLAAWRGPDRGAARAYTAMALVPIAAVAAISAVADTSYFLPRYLLGTLPAWAVLAGAGIAALSAGRVRRPRTQGLVAVAAVALVAALGLPDHDAMRRPGAHEERDYPVPVTLSWVDYEGAARIIRTGLRPGDGVVYSAVDQRLWHVDTGVQYYLRGGPQPIDALLGRSGTARDDLWAYDCADPDPCLDAAGAERIWLVAVVLRGEPRDPYTPLWGETARALKARYHVVRSEAVAGVYVSLLERGATPGAACPPGLRLAGPFGRPERTCDGGPVPT
ncbi:glycosyltransferase family 39 protein [Yinghuangia soli]|uniref:Glycosyltransferase family 39 protein n=1 Tax=Yinghuangia soli TaxID=2908204 RepID=A0AA41PXA8_9ACTN|nr:glycosyltransferase family 39 protein [Yinghuangia soli]MCF2527603.1 glycosyltransferase family 39 protein [Yinghuangia soli]